MKRILYAIAILCSIASCDVERLPYDAVDSSQAINDPDYANNALIGIYGNLKSKLSDSWINGSNPKFRIYIIIRTFRSFL